MDQRIDTTPLSFKVDTSSSISYPSKKKPLSVLEDGTPLDADDFSFRCVISCIGANRANTLALVAILRACTHRRPYREAEEEVSGLPEMELSHQNAHVLANLLVEAGGLQMIPTDDSDLSCGGDGDENDRSALCGYDNEDFRDVSGIGAVFDVSDGSDDSDNPDGFNCCDDSDVFGGSGALEDPEHPQPLEYDLLITPAGEAALRRYEPTERFCEMVSAEPKTYLLAYRRVLELAKEGVSRRDIELALKDEPCMRTPKLIYAGYFISKLETVNGIVWKDNCWNASEYADRMIALCGSAEA